MDKTIDQLKEELQIISMRLIGVEEEIKLKISEGERLFMRKQRIVKKIEEMRQS
jgi:hypothetical protein